METITETARLAEFCARCADFDYVTVDTEFLRERTYFSKLCLIQMAHPGDEDDGSAVLIDALSKDLDLEPLYALFRNPDVVKVFHAARQDLEIFSLDAGVIPEPFFDTQVAAMVCGFGDQVGYETLVRKICRKPLDKSSRFTDWSARPLSTKQQVYALGDVTHLRQIYEVLSEKLQASGRSAWVREELEILTNPDTYVIDPETAWMRVKTRTNSRKFLGIVKELAKFRETYARVQNVPRNRVFKDDALLELAATKPTNEAALGKSRLLLRETRRGPIAKGILAAIRTASETPADHLPRLPKPREKPQGVEGLSDLLRVLLKATSEREGVAQKLIASSADLDAIAGGETDLPVYRGWRKEVFGRDAKDLVAGRIALSAQGSSVKIVRL